jgi:spermidine synthase
LYYREGPTGIVTVKQTAGTMSLAIDGKVDASTSSDMLTQKALAHLPLLLHGQARKVGIIGLGSGVTLASALTHPIEAADVIEISPEVVEASAFFADYHRGALDDRRTRLILGDGRSHLALSAGQYDVIVSEPSNPWMAGVAALFTREFFEALRARLNPEGVVCQWAHAYDISDRDLRSIVRTFAAVFPQGTMWLAGDGDLLLIGSKSKAPLDSRLDHVSAGWTPAVAADLAGVSVHSSATLLSLFVGGPAELTKYGGTAAIQTDDRMALEFSGPRAVNSAEATSNAAALRALLDDGRLPAVIARVRASADAAFWRDRGAMMSGAGAHDVAYHDFSIAARLDPSDAGALAGLVRAAVALHREADTAAALRTLASANPRATAPRIALSTLEASTGEHSAAVAAAQAACQIEPIQKEALAQLASLYADAGDVANLERVVAQLTRWFPDWATTRYYDGAARFMRGDLAAASALAAQAIALDATRAESHNLLGAVQASRGEPAAARATFLAALGLDPRDSATYINLALLELSAGNGSGAAARFAEALSLDPASDTAREGLARARMAIGSR